jgi:L-alanine-DL-glutamate epimerase-like enolase superfamily enzyme
VGRDQGRHQDQDAGAPALNASTIRVQSVEASAYTVPTDGPEADGTFAWDSTTIVVVRVRAGGHTGLGYTYGPAAAAALVERELAGVVRGVDAFATGLAWAAMVDHVRNIGRSGAAALAISAVDTALWDLKARLLDVPLHRLMGAVRDTVPVYGSGGFTTYGDSTLADQLEGWLSDGARWVKIKIAESRGTRPERDVRRIRQVRDVVGSDVGVFVDANGGYTAKQAVRLLAEVADVGVTWFEEPVSSDDLAGLHLVRDRVDADVAAGEYGYDLAYFQRMCDAGAVDCLQADVTRCGGYTGWQQAATVAAAHGLEVSAHCAPNLSLPACAATRNFRHLEWFFDHVRIESALFEGARPLIDGAVAPTDAPGHGLALIEKAAEGYRVA